jgi:hypothetical protein
MRALDAWGVDEGGSISGNTGIEVAGVEDSEVLWTEGSHALGWVGEGRLEEGSEGIETAKGINVNEAAKGINFCTCFCWVFVEMRLLPQGEGESASALMVCERCPDEYSTESSAIGRSAEIHIPR